MVEKENKNQTSARRRPRQARSQYKVELMLEAAMQLLDAGDLAALTTNAVAARAGISIGTLYQYFDDKQALLDALIARELGALADKIMEALKGAAPGIPGERIRRIVRAVVDSYGGRGRVHRLLMEHALTLSHGRRLSPLYSQLLELFTAEGVAWSGHAVHRLTPAQAFVLTHAMAGVLRTLAASRDAPPLQEVEDALVQLIVGYMAGIR